MRHLALKGEVWQRRSCLGCRGLLGFRSPLTRDLKDLLILDGSQESVIPDDCAIHAILCARGATAA